MAAENVSVGALEGRVDVDGGVGEHVGRDGRVQQADSDGRTSSLFIVLSI